MSVLFTAVLNMSMTASYIVLGVLLIRLLLRKLPRIFAYVLWSAVLVRLVLPISFTSSFSFLTIFKPKVQDSTGVLEYIPYNIGLMQQPSVEVGISSLNHAVNNLLPAATPTASVNPMQTYMFVFSSIWLIGIIALLIYSVFAYLKVISSIKTATLVRDNIYETDQIDTPFVFGLIKPKIYLPLNLPINELPYILAHEQTHIKRLDYLVKPFSFLVLIVHWFNPLMWFSFVLMSKDMEMSCDENVIRQMGNGSKQGYSNSLLSLSVSRSGLIKGSPLAFGESHIKSRIKHILSYKKSALWVTLLAIVITASVIAAFTANPKNKHVTPAKQAYSGYAIEALINNKAPFIGNNSKVVALFDAMPLPVGIVRNTVELQTTNPPYGITTNLTMNDASDVTSEEGALRGNAFYRNSILLFSLIDNVDSITFRIKDNTGKQDGASYTFTFTIEMAEKLVGSEIRHYGKSTAALENLIDTIDQELLGLKITEDDTDTAKLSLLAALPDKAINLYSRESDGVILEVGGSKHYYDWLYLTPRGILPRMQVSDLDADGNEELSVILYIGSGTGVSIEELHVIQIPKEQTLTGDLSDNSNPEYFKDHLFKPDNYRGQLFKAVSFETLTQAGELTGKVTIGNKVQTLSLKDFQASDYGKINKDLVFGSIVRFNGENNKLKAEFGVGITTESSPVLNYIGVIDADVDYKAGEFMLKNLRFEKNQENQ